MDACGLDVHEPAGIHEKLQEEGEGMIYSRLFTAICVGILIPSLFAMMIRIVPSMDNLIFAFLCLIVTYGVCGYVSVWAAKEYAYMAATLVGAIVCMFQYSFTIVWIAGDMIFTPEIFALSLLLGIAISNLGAWLHLKRLNNRDHLIGA